MFLILELMCFYTKRLVCLLGFSVFAFSAMSAQSASFSVSSADANGKFTVSWSGARTYAIIAEVGVSSWTRITWLYAGISS